MGATVIFDNCFVCWNIDKRRDLSPGEGMDSLVEVKLLAVDENVDVLQIVTVLLVIVFTHDIFTSMRINEILIQDIPHAQHLSTPAGI